MTKQEFEELLETELTQEAYEKINTVYMWATPISKEHGKIHIRSLFKTFGMDIIEDMFPRAERRGKLSDELLGYTFERDEKCAEYHEKRRERGELVELCKRLLKADDFIGLQIAAYNVACADNLIAELDSQISCLGKRIDEICAELNL